MTCHCATNWWCNLLIWSWGFFFGVGPFACSHICSLRTFNSPSQELASELQWPVQTNIKTSSPVFLALTSLRVLRFILNVNHVGSQLDGKITANFLFEYNYIFITPVKKNVIVALWLHSFIIVFMGSMLDLKSKNLKLGQKWQTEPLRSPLLQCSCFFCWSCSRLLNCTCSNPARRSSKFTYTSADFTNPLSLWRL